MCRDREMMYYVQALPYVGEGIVNNYMYIYTKRIILICTLHKYYNCCPHCIVIFNGFLICLVMVES